MIAIHKKENRQMAQGTVKFFSAGRGMVSSTLHRVVRMSSSIIR